MMAAPAPFLALLLAAAVPAAQTFLPQEVAVLRGLDKITARVSTIEARVGGPVRFGTLEIIVRACRKRPPEEAPESAAFLEISDVKPGEPPRAVFTGWMFASSPAISALEHPVYDISLLDCTTPPAPSAESG